MYLAATISLQLQYSKVMSFVSSLQDLPMFTAVSCLSPVSTHTFIPACIKVFMVLGTPSYILSSIAVIPIISNSYSNSSANCSNCSCLLDIAFFAT